MWVGWLDDRDILHQPVLHTGTQGVGLRRQIDFSDYYIMDHVGRVTG